MPPGEQSEGKPFLVPPGERIEGQPWNDASEQPQGTNPVPRGQPQPAVSWQTPDLPALSPADVMPTSQPPAPVLTARSELPPANRQPARFPGVPAPPARSTYPSTGVVPRPATQFPYVK